MYTRFLTDRLVPQSADIVDAVVRRRVELDNVEDRAVVDAAAARALVAGVAAYGVLAVDSLGKDLGAGGLAGPTRADEEVRVAEVAGLHLIFKRFRDVRLPDDIVKAAGTPFSV